MAIQGFTLFEVGALVGTLLWGWLSDLANGRRALGGLRRAGVDYRHPRRLPAREQPVRLPGIRALRARLPGVGPQLLIGVAAVGFVPKKAIGAADGIKGTFAYLIGDSFAKLGSGQ